MISRRMFGRLGLAAAGGRMFTEMAYAQRALVRGNLPRDMVWLNANENPAGPPPASIAAMAEALAGSGRYHYQEFGDFYTAVAHSEDLSTDQVTVGAGSSEVLHYAIDAFTSSSRPLITPVPTYEGPMEVAARGLGRPVVRVPLTADYRADVKRLAQEAGKANGGLIYLCNPNNPTSTITPKEELAWLVANLPSNTILLVDEAYIHFSDSPNLESALTYVRQGKDVIVTRTFSKIYGMAGLRAGFACARPGLIEKLEPLRMNVISCVTVRAVRAALTEAATLVPQRRADIIRTRQGLTAWLRDREINFIEPHGNFLMIDVGRDAREFISAMPQRGVAVGRPFPPLTNLLRVSIGTESDMSKFRDVFWSIYKG
jgi:histidinol-phosphate aminotransferase